MLKSLVDSLYLNHTIAGIELVGGDSIEPYSSVSPIASWVFGTALLLFLTMVVFVLKDPTDFQKSIIRFLMALAAAFFSIFFIGGVLLNGTIKSLAVSATGEFVLFILIQFVYNPFKVLPTPKQPTGHAD